MTPVTPVNPVTGYGRLSRARRQIASGTSIVEATARTAAPGSGPQDRATRWKDLRARQWGMTPELMDLVGAAGVTDVLINGTEVWVDSGQGCQSVGWGPTSEAECRSLAIQMAAAAGKRLDDSSPLVDGFLGQTVRLHAVIPPLSGEVTAISLRVLRPQGFSLERLVEVGTVPAGVEPLLRQVVDRRVSAIISGATGSGKTTLLGALLALVPADQRIVCIEEVSELFPTHPHVVHLQERQSNIEGVGEISLSQLVRAALRMRPDRLVLGECRGAEVREVLSAMNTGHSGFTTIHANAAADVPSRLLALGSLAGLGENAVRAHAVAAFRVVLHLARDHEGKRRLREVGVLTGEERLRCELALDCSSGRPRPGPGAALLESVVA